MIKSQNRIGEVSVILAATMWGCIGIFTRALYSMGFTSVQTVAVRAVITTFVMLIAILIKDKNLLKIRLRDVWIFIGTGLCSFLFFNLCYMNSIKQNSLSVASILLYTSPVWVTVLSRILFKERLTKRKCISLPICLLGCVCVCCSSSLNVTKIGIIFGLFSGFGYALYSIFGKVAVDKYHSLTITFYTFLFASIGALPFCNVLQLGKLLINAEVIPWAIGIAFINTVLPYLLYTYGLSKTSPSTAAVISILEPVVAALVGVIAFDENLGYLGILGIITVVAGLVILESSKND